MCEQAGFVFENFDFDFLGGNQPPFGNDNSEVICEIPSTSRHEPLEAVQTPAQKRHGLKSKEKRSRLSERIASTDALVKSLKDFQEGAKIMKSLYDAEKLQRVHHEDRAQKFQLENELLRDEVTQLKFKCDQLEAQTEESKSLELKEVASGYVRLVHRITQESKLNSCAYALLKREQELFTKLKAYCKTNNITFRKVAPLNSPRRNRSATNQVDKAVECLLWQALPETVSPTKPDTCTRGTQCVPIQTRNQSVQYKSTTTTRSTTTAGLIQKHDMGTSYTKPVQLASVTEILAEMKSWQIQPISPIIDLIPPPPSPPALRSTSSPMQPIEAPTLEQEVAMEAALRTNSVGTCTSLCNVQKEIDYVQPFPLPKVKHSTSRPPSRQMCSQDQVKNESQQQQMPTSRDLNHQFGPLVVETFDELWCHFGRMVFSLLQHRSTSTASLTPLSNESFTNWIRTLIPTDLNSQFLPNAHNVPCSYTDVQRQSFEQNEQVGLKERSQDAETSPIHTLDCSNAIYVDSDQEHETSLHKNTQLNEHEIQRIQLCQPKVPSSDDQSIAVEPRTMAGDFIEEEDMQPSVGAFSSGLEFSDLDISETSEEEETNSNSSSDSIAPIKCSAPSGGIFPLDRTLHDLNDEFHMPEQQNDTADNNSLPEGICDWSYAPNVVKQTQTSPQHDDRMETDSSVNSFISEEQSDTSLSEATSNDTSISGQSHTTASQKHDADSSINSFISEQQSDTSLSEAISNDTSISGQSHTKASQKHDAGGYANIKSSRENAVEFICSFEGHNDAMDDSEIALLAAANSHDADVCLTSSSSSSSEQLFIDEDANAWSNSSNNVSNSPELSINSLDASTACESDIVPTSKPDRKRKAPSITTEIPVIPCKNEKLHLADENYFHDENTGDSSSRASLLSTLFSSSSSSYESLETKEVKLPHDDDAATTSRNLVDDTFAQPRSVFPNSRSPSPIYVPESKHCHYLYGYDTPASPPPVNNDENATEQQPHLIPTKRAQGHQRQSLLNYLIRHSKQSCDVINDFDESTKRVQKKMLKIIDAYFTKAIMNQAAAENVCMELQLESADAATYAAAFCDYVKSKVAQLEMNDWQLLICVVLLLEDQHRDFITLLMEKIDDSLFSLDTNRNNLPMEINLTQFYLTLAELETKRAMCSTTLNADYRNPARLFIAKALYYLPKHAIRLIYEVLAKFPTVLPHREERNYDNTDPLITVIKHELMHHKYNMTDSDAPDREMLSNLRFKYHFEAYKPLTQDVIKLLVDNLRAGKLEHLQLAFVVLCKRLTPELVVKKVLTEHLMPMAKDFYVEALHGSEYDERIVILLECISIIVKALPLTTCVQAYLKLFMRFLNAISKTHVQEAAVQAIIRLQRFGYRASDQALQLFCPNHNVQTLTMSMLNSYVVRRRSYFGLDKKKKTNK